VTKIEEIAIAALERTSNSEGVWPNIVRGWCDEALAAIRSVQNIETAYSEAREWVGSAPAPVACGHLQTGDYFDNAGGCRVCNVPVETLENDLGLMKHLEPFIHQGFTWKMLGDVVRAIDAYRRQQRERT
jgi:hypothetical protein